MEKTDKFEIIGGKKLEGHIRIDGAKNAALPIIAASILTKEKVVLKDVPQLSDVFKMIEILAFLGGTVCFEDRDIIIDNSNLTGFEIPENLMSELRASFFMLGPIAARQKRARVAFPGGCDIGKRPVDIHLDGLKTLHAYVEENDGFIGVDAGNMCSGTFRLRSPSVGATENLMMAAVFLDGVTTIENAAKEPEVEDLANFINALGGKITGAGTSVVSVEGVKELKSVEYTLIPDRIACGTFLVAAAVTGGKICVSNCISSHVVPLLTILRKSGCKIVEEDGKIELESSGMLKVDNLHIETAPYPDFPTDLQAVVLTLFAASEGESSVKENLFESRFKHVPELAKMSARIKVDGQTATVTGNKLLGADVDAGDLRGGAALVIAGLAASGTTVVSNVHYIDRGYEAFEEKLSSLGADIRRIKENE